MELAGRGAIVLRDTALSAHPTGSGFEVRTTGGAVYRGRRLLLATGAYTNGFDRLHPRLDLDVRVETVWLERVSPPDVERLRTMPAIWYDFEEYPAFPYAYLLPPVRYPDGHHYVKIGVDRDPDAEHDAPAGINAFFRSGGNAQRGQELRALLHTLLPDLPLAEGLTKPCILTYTPHGRPMVDAARTAGVFVAVGGCGGAAKSSDEIGRMAALLVREGTWAHDFDAGLFRACYC